MFLFCISFCHFCTAFHLHFSVFFFTPLPFSIIIEPQGGITVVKIACLLPREEMVAKAWKALEEDGVDWREYRLTIDHGPSPHAIEWSRKAVENNVDIIIARGLQATLIKQNTTIPVVEVRLTGQEMGLLIANAKAIVNRRRILIGIVGYENQFCNMDHFSEIFDVDLRLYYAQSTQNGSGELRACALQAIQDQVDIIIGGDTAQDEAAAANIPGLFITSTSDSFGEAFRAARRTAYAIEMEKSNTAQIKTLLDNAFEVIVRTDADGRITLVNHVAETLLGWTASSVYGRFLHEVADSIDTETMNSVLKDGTEMFSQYIHIGKTSMVANLVPIHTGDSTIGAILSAQEVEQLEEMGTAARRHQYKLDRIAKTHFETITEPSASIRQAVGIAQLYAKSDAPVLISSEPGNRQDRFAQAIHNESKRRNGPFVSINCAESDADIQVSLLFGGIGNQNTGMLSTAHSGTVLLENIQGLRPTCQHRLLGLLRDGVLFGGDLQPYYVNVRVIATCDDSLPRLVEESRFFPDLYYMLNTLFLPLDPLRKRPDDILHWADHYTKLYRDRYMRYISLTSGARRQLQSYNWHGNLFQLQAFFRRLVLTAKRRTVDENEIHDLFTQMYPVVLTTAAHAKVEKGAFYHNESALIKRLLAQHNGNRSRVAAEMGISTTTLWRKTKKYNIHNAFLSE